MKTSTRNTTSFAAAATLTVATTTAVALLDRPALAAASDEQLDPDQRTELCRGDINHDGVVDQLDLELVFQSWGTCPSPNVPEQEEQDPDFLGPPITLPCPADIFGADSIVDAMDLLTVLAEWGACPTAEEIPGQIGP